MAILWTSPSLGILSKLDQCYERPSLGKEKQSLSSITFIDNGSPVITDSAGKIKNLSCEIELWTAGVKGP